MFLKKLVLGMLALVTWASLLQAVQVSTYTNEWHMKDYATFGHGFNIVHDDDGLLYTICGRTRLHSETDCNITLEIPTVDRTPAKMTCPIKIVTAEGRMQLRMFGKLSAFVERVGKRRAVMFWMEVEKNTPKALHKIYEILDLTDCSKVRLLDYISNKGNMPTTYNTIVYPHGFDLIIHNTSICNGLNTCRVSYNEKGQQIDGPVAFNMTLFDALAYPVSTTSADKGFLLWGTIKPDYKLAAEHVSATGLRTHLITVKDSNFEGFLNFVNTPVAISSTYDTYGLCWGKPKERIVECAQFNASGNEKIRTRLEFDKPVQALVVYNLREGGMLVASIDYDEETHEVRGFDVARFRQDGGKDKVVVKVTGSNLKCDYLRLISAGLSSGVSETSNQYCFYFVCSTKPTELEGSSVAKYVKQCIGKEMDASS